MDVDVELTTKLEKMDIDEESGDKIDSDEIMKEQVNLFPFSHHLNKLIYFLGAIWRSYWRWQRSEKDSKEEEVGKERKKLRKV